MRLLLVCDGLGDVANLKRLTHRILCEDHRWLIDQDIEWVEYEAGRTFLDIHHVHKAADAWRGVSPSSRKRPIPKPLGLGRGHGAAAANRAFLLGKELARETGELGVVFVWDVDDAPERVAAIGKARDETAGICIAVGLAAPEHEAWCICAFEPESAAEKEAHQVVSKDLGFDPLVESERLSHKKQSITKKDAKTVLARLCPDEIRSKEFLRTTPLDLLRARGEKNGYRAFHDEVLARLGSLFRG